MGIRAVNDGPVTLLFNTVWLDRSARAGRQITDCHRLNLVPGERRHVLAIDSFVNHYIVRALEIVVDHGAVIVNRRHLVMGQVIVVGMTIPKMPVRQKGIMVIGKSETKMNIHQ